ncbi:MAG: hypothetical protein K0S32_3894 [Bacteroidetes bacterium]|jgi:hypothetical protein|nr:hypothetical protein [Bacteroidota bacterium]
MKTFDTPNFVMNVHNDGFIEFRIKKGISLSAADVWLSRDLSCAHLPGMKFVVLTETEDEFRLTQEARQAGASEEYAKHVAAHALYTNNLTLKILSNLFIRVSRPVVPTRFFDERDKAIAWLKSFQKK